MSARRCFVIGLMVLAGTGSGCGSGTAPLPSSTSAREALQVALDAWKAGKPAASLSAHEPKIEAVDFEWRAGKALTEYAVQGDAPGEGTQTLTVSLTLKGTPAKEVKYMVMGLDPIRIYRDEDFTRAMNMDNNPTTSKKGRR